MNYYVVSPNARNDGNCETYLNYMKRRHVVFMGWDTDTKHGKTFANLQIGDRIIVARGANWQKKSFFAGIVDSGPLADYESGFQFTQYRELRSVVILDEDELPFTTDCTGGKRKQPGAIYRLKPTNNADAKIIHRVEKLLEHHSFRYSLREISNWNLNNRVAIPALQRGLVWSPKQVELLWDSMLRGFPVGSFAITEAKSSIEQYTESTSSETQYFLLDGQQRYNAISLGYQIVTDASKAVIWIDLLPPVVPSSTKKFWIKVTTSSHPWGFANDDNSTLLGWSKYRQALQKFTDNPNNIENIKLKNLSLKNTWPIESGCPVRLAEILNSYRSVTSHHVNSQSSDLKKCFVDEIIHLISSKKDIYAKSWKNNEDNIKRISDYLEKLYEVFERIDTYRITANVFDNQLIEDEESSLAEGKSSIENLFTRLNTLGTEISPYDLRYSAIKAYWGSIKETNDKIAEEIMPAAHLAILAFRLAMTLDEQIKESNKELKLANIPTISQIRNFGKKRDCGPSLIVTKLYENDGKLLREVISSVESALNVSKNSQNNSDIGMLPLDGMPPVLRTAIIYDSQDLYLLLMCLGYLNKIQDCKATGFALWIHWFNLISKKDICDAIYRKMLSSDENSLAIVFHELGRNKQILTPVDPCCFDFLPPRETLQTTWNFEVYQNYEIYPWMHLFDKIRWNQQLMIFACRKYFNETFDYDPALTNFSAGHNKPWDIDHIIPKAWMMRQGKSLGDWKPFCQQWLYTIGNLAAIPFTINRQKSDRGVWEAYCKHSNELNFDCSIKDISEEKLTYQKEAAHHFGRICNERMKNFYVNLLEVLKHEISSINYSTFSSI